MSARHLHYKPASRWKRILSYLVEVIPVVVLVYLVFYYSFPEYAKLFDKHFFYPVTDAGDYADYLYKKAQVRDISLIVWSLYSLVMDALPTQGTLMKKLLGLSVIDSSGKRLTWSKSIVRNFAKVIGTLPLGLGMIWIFFDKFKRPMHDKVSGTFVVEVDHSPHAANSELMQLITKNEQSFSPH